MNIKIKILFFILLIPSLLYSQDMNVMSYYSSDNNLDGQPMIGMTNVLRFFPVFALQDSIKKVTTTVYYGGKIDVNEADKLSGGKYWQSLLPRFQLGDAIQRVEVEVEFYLDSRYREKLRVANLEREVCTRKSNKYEASFRKSLITYKDYRSELLNEIGGLRQELQDGLGVHFKTVRSIIDSLVQKNILDSYSIAMNSDSLSSNLNDIINNLPSTRTRDESTKKDISERMQKLFLNEDQVEDVVKKIDQYKNVLEGSKEKREKFFEESYAELEIIKNTDREEYANAQCSARLDTIKQEIFEKIVGSFADTSFSGPSIRKSDLVIDNKFKTARMLYRYYNDKLRYRKSLDPAERLGIFRVRFVPFPIVGTKASPKVQLIRPGEKGSPAVFEIGLSFGDDVVSGNNTFKPALSLSRLGVAIVITEQLFKEDAQIFGLALTYDFNSYGSIGYGRNLAGKEDHPYYSFGINKKAFQQLMRGMASIFTN